MLLIQSQRVTRSLNTSYMSTVDQFQYKQRTRGWTPTPAPTAVVLGRTGIWHKPAAPTGNAQRTESWGLLLRNVREKTSKTSRCSEFTGSVLHVKEKVSRRWHQSDGCQLCHTVINKQPHPTVSHSWTSPFHFNHLSTPWHGEISHTSPILFTL